MILIHQRHRQTDRQTDRRTTCNLNTALCTSASRGKNWKLCPVKLIHKCSLLMCVDRQRSARLVAVDRKRRERLLSLKPHSHCERARVNVRARTCTCVHVARSNRTRWFLWLHSHWLQPRTCALVPLRTNRARKGTRALLRDFCCNFTQYHAISAIQHSIACNCNDMRPRTSTHAHVRPRTWTWSYARVRGSACVHVRARAQYGWGFTHAVSHLWSVQRSQLFALFSLQPTTTSFELR